MKNEKNNERLKAWKSANSKTPNKSRKRETQSVKTPTTVPCNCYTRQDIEGVLMNVLIASVSIAALLLTLTMFIAALKH